MGRKASDSATRILKVRVFIRRELKHVICEMAYGGEDTVRWSNGVHLPYGVLMQPVSLGKTPRMEDESLKKYWTILSIWIDFDDSNLTVTQRGWWKRRLRIHVTLPTGHSGSQMGTISTAHTLKGLFSELLEQHVRSKCIYACKLLFFKQFSIMLPLLICVQGDKYWKESSLWKESATPSRVNLI